MIAPLLSPAAPKGGCFLAMQLQNNLKNKTSSFFFLLTNGKIWNIIRVYFPYFSKIRFLIGIKESVMQRDDGASKRIFGIA